jgi:hypothetical protein
MAFPQVELTDPWANGVLGGNPYKVPILQFKAPSSYTKKSPLVLYGK